MQISRHWRMNPQRYRLQGVRYANGEVSLQARPQPVNETSRSLLPSKKGIFSGQECAAKTVIDTVANESALGAVEGGRRGKETAA